MIKTQFTLLAFLLITCSIWSQNRYKDTIFSSIQKRTFNYADTLLLDFYDSKSDIEKMRPLVILVHGGGFVAGQRNGGDEKGLSTILAKRGYAVASINYRLTLKGKSFGCDCQTDIKMNTYVQAVEDVIKSIYYLTTYDTTFKVDPNKIILIGSSAGAETILNTIIMKNNYLFQHIKYPNTKVIGAVSFAGATINSDYLTQENLVPMLFFHGQLDNKIPFGIASHHYCPSNSNGYLILDGPKKITNRIKELDGSYIVNIDPDGGHEWASLGYKFTDKIIDFLYLNVLNKEPIKDTQVVNYPFLKL